MPAMVKLQGIALVPALKIVCFCIEKTAGDLKTNAQENKFAQRKTASLRQNFIKFSWKMHKK